jgi:hypothetical protein
VIRAWTRRNRLVLGQETTEEKGKETTATPSCLPYSNSSAALPALDAMGYPRADAGQNPAQGGDHVLSLKGNQSTLQERVEDVFEVALAGTFSGVAHAVYEEIDKDHERLEVRRYWITDDVRALPDNPRWGGLRSIGLVERRSTAGESETVERHYFIYSIPAQTTLFSNAVRGHWVARIACTRAST